MKATQSIKAFIARAMVVATVATSVLATAQPLTAQAAGETLLNTYGKTYGYSGTCINSWELKDASTLRILKQDYNSITLENEMKPDALLGNSCTTMTVAQAKAQGYYIPSNYKESVVPKINFGTVDQVMEVCYKNGLKMRAHTLVWHSQTPSWFFRSNYSGNGGFVSTSVMDARLEMYVKSVINHVYNNQYGSVIYAWDVANEIQHASNSGWEAVYGNNRTSATYVKKAFEYAYDALSQFGLNGKVKLYSNDYNTYEKVNEEIALINYINSSKKVCDGIGMQCHLATNYPDSNKFMNAMNSFLKAGLEVQITELDVTNNGDQDLSNYCSKLFDAINAAKKSGANISGITWWGLSDNKSWRSSQKPLLFSQPGVKKSAYNTVINSFTKTFGNNAPEAGNSDITPTNPPSGNTGETTENPSTGENTSNTNDSMQCEEMTLSGNYAGKINNPFSGVALYANNDAATYTQYFANTTHDFTLRGCSNNSKRAAVDLLIGGVKKGTFYFNNATPTDVTIKNVEHGTGNQTIKLVVSTDDGNWDAYIDALKISQVGSSSGNQGGETTKPSTGETSQEEQTTDPTPATPATGKLSAAYTINNWGSGYQVSIKVENKSGARVDSWTLTIPKSQIKINASWNVTIKESGDNYVITPVSWNSVIENGNSVEFGVQGNGSIGTTLDITVK